MKVVHSLQPSDSPAQRTIATFGTFDGVHRGHRHLFAEMRRLAQAEAEPTEVAVITFHPHPLVTVAPERAPATISTLDTRLVEMEGAGVDIAFVVSFDEEFSRVTAEAFVNDVLAGCAKATHVLVGPDSRFGHRRTGNRALLQKMGSTLGFTVGGVDPLFTATPGGEDRRISSTWVRDLVTDGAVEQAAELLGRPFALEGKVVMGDRRGRLLGFPTANVQAAEGMLLPSFGVYAGFLRRLDRPEEPALASAINVGIRPTFDGTRLSIEAHAIDFSGDLYGAHVAIEFQQRIRGEMKFDSVDALVEQVQRDIAAVRGVTTPHPRSA